MQLRSAKQQLVNSVLADPYVPTWIRPRCEILSCVKFSVFDRNSTVYKKHWNITLKNLLKHGVRFYVVNCFTLVLVATKVKNSHGVVLSLLLPVSFSHITHY